VTSAFYQGSAGPDGTPGMDGGQVRSSNTPNQFVISLLSCHFFLSIFKLHIYFSCDIF